MPHTCHAHGCNAEVPPKMFMCKPHWFRLRKPLQKAIWAEYRPGQERDKNPSDRYLAVQQLAVAEMAYKDHTAAVRKLAGQREASAEPDAMVTAIIRPYLLAAMAAAGRAIHAGAGDPLMGLLPNLPAVTP